MYLIMHSCVSMQSFTYVGQVKPGYRSPLPQRYDPQGPAVNIGPQSPFDSIELRTVQKCIPVLESALIGLERNFVHFLHAEGFLSDNVHDEILNPRSMLSESDKTGEVVRQIVRRVKLDPQCYHTLLYSFKSRGNIYRPIVNKMEFEFSMELSGKHSKGDYMHGKTVMLIM